MPVVPIAGDFGSSQLDRDGRPRRNFVFQGREYSLELSDSSQSSYSCKSSDSLPEWSHCVDGNGSLFYLKNYEGLDVTQESSNHPQPEDEGDKEKTNNLGLFVRLIRRRNSRRSVKRKDNEAKLHIAKPTLQNNSAKVQEELQTYNVPIKLDKRLGDSVQSSLLLQELGLVLKPIRTHLVVQGITPHSSCSFKSEITLGDHLIGINGTDVNAQNVDVILNSLPSAQQILLRFSKTSPIRNIKLEAQAHVSDTQGTLEDTANFDGVAVIYCTLEPLKESSSPSESIIYSFPSKSNSLSPLIGLFLTLNHLLPTISSKQPISTNLVSNGKGTFVSYTVESDGVLLIALPFSMFSELDSSFVVSHLRNYLLFNYQTLSTCFKSPENKVKLDEFFNNFFTTTPLGLGKLQQSLFRVTNPITPAAHFLPLSHEAYVQLDDALNELESNNMEVYESERLYSIIGSCYFYKGFLLCSHLAKEDLVEVSSLCHHFSLFFESKPLVKQLVFWKEVFPLSVGRGLSPPSHEPYTPQPGRFFLLIVGKDDALLPVLFQSVSWSFNEESSKLGPNVFYVEEAESTLLHIQRIGIPSYVNKWLGLNNPSPPENSVSIGRLNQVDSSPNLSQLYDMPSSNSSVSIEGSDLFSPVGSGAQGGGPVVGRRAERERLIESCAISKVSGSDFSDDSDWAKDSKSSRRSELMDLGSSPFDSLAPPRVGGNAMIYYLHAGSFSGLFISSHKTHPVRSDLLSHFISSCHHIHNIFLSAINFKKLKVQEIPGSLINKSLIAIKEHGLLFSLETPANNGKNHSTENYWVIGRLFSTPSLKEVYVCHLDSCPLNLVELTFRLTLNTLL